jgi:hypothetical protein
MKKYFIATLLTLMAGATLSGQMIRTDYYMKNSYDRLSMNPAFMPRQGYVGFPGLSSLSLEETTNSIYLDNLLFDDFDRKVTFMHPSVSAKKFLDKIPAVNHGDVGINSQLLSYGFFTENGSFWNFGLGMKTFVNIEIPKSLFELLKEGFTSEETPVNYNVRDLNMKINGYAELSAGYARSFLDGKLQAGAKAKLLFGLMGLDLNIEKLDISASNSEWRALSQASIKGTGFKAKYNDENGMFKTMELNSSGVGGMGLGFDLGGVYEVFDGARVSLALTDLGFISWFKSSSMYLRSSSGKEIVVTPGLGEDVDITDGIDFQTSFDKSVEDIREALNFTESPGVSAARTSSLRTTLNAGFEYDVLPKYLSAGLLLSSHFGLVNATELTLSANCNPTEIKWLSVALSYSFLRSPANALGLALHLAPTHGIHFFVAGDYFIPKVNKQFIPINANVVNIQLGLAIPLGKVRDSKTFKPSEGK